MSKRLQALWFVASLRIFYDSTQRKNNFLPKYWFSSRFLFIFVRLLGWFENFFFLGKLLHHISNQGARSILIKKYLPEHFLPLLESVAINGERQCFVVILYADDELVWDEAHPPPFGEETKKGLSSSPFRSFDSSRRFWPIQLTFRFQLQLFLTLSLPSFWILRKIESLPRKSCRREASKKSSWASKDFQLTWLTTQPALLPPTLTDTNKGLTFLCPGKR